MSAPEVAQVRLEGRIPGALYEALEAITSGGPLAPLYLDIRDDYGDHVLQLPARIVSLERRDTDGMPVLGVEIGLVCIVEDPPKKSVCKATVAQVAAAREEPVLVGRGTPRRRLSREEIEQRDAAIVQRQKDGWTYAMIARQFSISVPHVNRILARARLAVGQEKNKGGGAA